MVLGWSPASRTAANHALQRLEAAGVAEPGNDSSAWRTGTDILAPDIP
jgi:hypothetical protein